MAVRVDVPDYPVEPAVVLPALATAVVVVASCWVAGAPLPRMVVAPGKRRRHCAWVGLRGAIVDTGETPGDLPRFADAALR